MNDVLARIVENMGDRISGPMHLRIFLQPAMAMLFASLDGWKDAKAGKPPYFWSLLMVPEHRTEMLQSGWKSIGKVFILAIVLDGIYQIIALKFIYPGELLLVALLLALAPYLVLRGVVGRIASRT